MVHQQHQLLPGDRGGQRQDLAQVQRVDEVEAGLPPAEFTPALVDGQDGDRALRLQRPDQLVVVDVPARNLVRAAGKQERQSQNCPPWNTRNPRSGSERRKVRVSVSFEAMGIPRPFRLVLIRMGMPVA